MTKTFSRLKDFDKFIEDSYQRLGFLDYLLDGHDVPLVGFNAVYELDDSVVYIPWQNTYMTTITRTLVIT